MSSNIAINVEGLSKCYRIYSKPQDRFKEFLLRGKHKYAHEYWALRDVSFEVTKGECFGILGRNGAGKSTLLQIIAGTLDSTAGSISLNGRIAALLELGSGFNPEFSGRENVYINAAVLGLNQAQIDTVFDDWQMKIIKRESVHRKRVQPTICQPLSEPGSAVAGRKFSRGRERQP